MTLTATVQSTTKRNIYGVAGEQVRLISAHHYPVLIVEGIKGRFPVHYSKTDYDPLHNPTPSSR